jgi:hypothetical protein
MTTPTANRPSTYFAFHNDEANDPFHREYGTLMAIFQASVARESPARAKALYEQVFTTSEVQPHVYLMCTLDHALHPVITVIHRPYRHVAPMGSTVDKCDVAFMGDMRGLLPPTLVYFPEDGFKHTGPMLVPKAETLDQAFAEDTTLQAVGPYAEGDDGTDVIATRSIVYVPPQYASIFLANATMTPRKAWEAVGGLIRTGDNAESQVQAMQPLLSWFRAACTKCSAVLTDLSTDWSQHRLISEPPSYPHPPVPSLDLAIEARLKTDLPGIVTDTGPQTSTTQAINNMTSQMISMNQERNYQGSTVGGPTTYYGTSGLDVLYRMTYATGLQSLPEIYKDIAKAPKRGERMALEEGLRAVADTLGLVMCAPLATVGLTKKLGGCLFAHIDHDDLEAGIHPFCTTYRTPQSRTQLRNTLAVYDDLREGTGATLHDFALLREAEKVGLPYTMSEVTYALKSFRVLLHTLLGQHHPMVKVWDDFVSIWIDREVQMQELLTAYQYPLILRWLQIRFSTWFTDQSRDPCHIAAPDFKKLIEYIVYGETSWHPLLPPQYRPIVPALGGPPSATPPTRPSPRAPALPAPVPVLPAPGNPGRGDRIPNAQFDAAFTPFRQLNLSLSAVRDKAKAANKPIPHNTTNTEFCLSYHILGFCWAQCNRKEDHRAHDAAETTSLLNWCGQCYREGGPN